MQPFDQDTFVTFIQQRHLAQEQQIPYFVKWVKKFLATQFPPIAVSHNDKIQVFSDLLARDPTILDWQLRQAVKAVELYTQVFILAPQSTQPAATLPDKEADITEADKVFAEMRDLIRLRHYSYRTEQTYLDWVRRYMGYALNHDLNWKQNDSVKAFLSSLATKHDVAASTQNQAFSALLFLLREVLKQDNPDMKSVRGRTGDRTLGGMAS